ncbi:MAG: serine/threonine protein kinase [Myxococcales bacterium]|nr:serine/threonine protein kinase [Myxococcales bacterium]
MDVCPSCSRVYQEHHDFCSSDGTPLEAMRPGHDPLVGRRFDDRYELVRMVGAGGNGVVYVARQIGLGRVVAFKMMFAERMREERAMRRFAREARALAALDHPGCVRVLDYRAEPDAVPYLVMELVEGFPLVSLIGISGLPPQHAIIVALRIAEAVDAAHRAGIVHRDLKPENVILDLAAGELRVRLIDFGLALVFDRDKGRQSRLTAENRVVGTPEYMAPEQIKGEDADGRTDLYALGVLIYELLTGVPPFKGPTASATLGMHLDDPPPPLPLRNLDGTAADALRSLVYSLLEKRPENRPRDAAEVATSLRALWDLLPDAGPAASIVERPRAQDDRDTESIDAADTDVSVELPEHEDPFVRKPPPPPATPVSAWTPRRWLTTIAIGSLVSTIAGGVVALVAHPRAASPPPASPPSVEPTVPPEHPEGRVVVEEVAPDAPIPTDTLPTGGTVELPGGDAQAQYESALRALGSRLAQQGLRPRDIRSHPRGIGAWTAQVRAASRHDYGEAAAQVGEMTALASTKTAREWMIYRLQRVEAARADASPAEAARRRALWGTLERSAGSAAGVRQWMRRVDALEDGL